MTKGFLRKEGNSQKTNSVAKAIFSLLILSTIAVQLQSALLTNACHLLKTPLCALPAEPDLYPFLDYPMYSRARTEAEATVDKYKVIAVFADGSEKQLKGEDFGLSPYWFVGSLVPAFAEQDTSKITDYIEAYDARGNPPFVGFRVDMLSMAVTAEGLRTDDVLIGQQVSTISEVQ